MRFRTPILKSGWPGRGHGAANRAGGHGDDKGTALPSESVCREGQWGGGSTEVSPSQGRGRKAPQRKESGVSKVLGSSEEGRLLPTPATRTAARKLCLEGRKEWFYKYIEMKMVGGGSNSREAIFTGQSPGGAPQKGTASLGSQRVRNSFSDTYATADATSVTHCWTEMPASTRTADQ